ncbi:hypothetical protein D3C72_1456040 [compost metagenome]
MQRLCQGLLYIVRITDALSDVKALTAVERGIDIVGSEQYPGLIPLTELLGRTHGMISGIQAFFQGGDPRALKPSGTQNARGTGDAAQLVKVGQVAHPSRTVVVQVGDARQQHMGSDQ